MPDFEVNWHHLLVCAYLDKLASGKIKKLMIFIPPQHGKSELTSRRFPAYVLGKSPKTKIVLASYSSDLSTSFNRDTQRIITTQEYKNVFEGTTLNERNVVTSAQGSYLRNADIFEIVGKGGFLKTVGVGGSLTGTPADIGIIDDPVKDPVQARSRTYQQGIWDWYCSVFETRLHNNSRQLLVMTRWDKNDLAGKLLEKEPDKWVVVKLPAIKVDNHNPEDPREIGEALWEKKHSKDRIARIKDLNPRTYDALYQQDPKINTELIIYQWFVYKTHIIALHVFYGLDFGFNKPSALVKVCVYDGEYYISELLYETNLTNTELIAKMKELIPNKNSHIFCDSAEPDRIAEIQQAGFNAYPAKKDVSKGIDTCKSKRLNIHENSPNLLWEIERYCWKQSQDGTILDEPQDGNDHALDAMRYAIYTEENKPTQSTAHRPAKQQRQTRE